MNERRNPDPDDFPSISQVRADAIVMKVNPDDAVLVTLYAHAMKYSHEAFMGAFDSIYLLYQQGKDLVAITVESDEKGWPQLRIEHNEYGELRNRYLGGLIASRDQSWHFTTVIIAGKTVTPAQFFDSISHLNELSLTDKDVGDLILDVDGD